ncbi:hypothetical protein [Algoriphagus marinus]|uniref:hypothetical protein n=1 Tax=Algoriphagus marinus TaxID=1925762 RepID=UPI00094BC16C|nr:hypothetical protein [Algoriphagus marinus]
MSEIPLWRWNLIEALNHTVENDHVVVKPSIAPGEVRNPGLKEIRLLVSRAGFTFGKGRPVREDGNGFFNKKILKKNTGFAELIFFPTEKPKDITESLSAVFS